MNTLFCFDGIIQHDSVYNVQGKIIFDPLFFYSKNELPILSFIIEDVNKKRIECVAFGNEAEQNVNLIEINKIYQINFVTALNNIKYVKTQHKFKLHLSIDSEIYKIKNQKYLKNKKVCIKFKKQKKNKIFTDKKMKHQLAITNWIKRKK